MRTLWHRLLHGKPKWLTVDQWVVWYRCPCGATLWRRP